MWGFFFTFSITVSVGFSEPPQCLLIAFPFNEFAAAFCKAQFARLRENRSQRKRRSKKKWKSGAADSGPAENFQADDMAWLDEKGRGMSNRRESNLTSNRREALEECDQEENVDDPLVLQDPANYDQASSMYS